MKPQRAHRLRHALAPGGAGARPDVLDPAALARLRQLDPDGARGFLTQVMRAFDASMVRQLGFLEEARCQGDLKRAGEVAHSLKSSSASVGALSFSQGCTQVERLAKAGDASALGEPLAALQAEGARVLTAVRAMLRA